jgi:SAM-dependent methyltransferase
MMGFKSDDIVLDSGCGSGYISYEISKKVKSVLSVDISKKLINSLNSVNIKNNMNFLCIDLNKLNKTTTSQIFDKIICLDVLEHVETPENIFKNLSEILKTNGKICFTIPLENHGHFKLKKNEIIRILKNNNLNIKVCKQIKQPLITNLIEEFILLARTLIKVCPKEVDIFHETTFFKIEQNPTFIYKIYKMFFPIFIVITHFDKLFRENGNTALIICEKV